MKIKKNQRNLLKFYLLEKKIYKVFSSKTVCQLIKLKNIELQLKKVIKFFFKFMLKNKNLKNSIFLNSSSILKKKKLINLNLLYFFISNKLISIDFLNKTFKSSFLQLFCSFYITYLKKQKISNVTGELTYILFTDNLKNLKLIETFHCFNYLIFWGYTNTDVILKLFYFLIVKLSKSSSRKFK